MSSTDLVVNGVVLILSLILPKYVNPILPEGKKVKSIAGKVIFFTASFVVPVFYIFYTIISKKTVDKEMVATVAFFQFALLFNIFSSLFFWIRKDQARTTGKILDLISELTDKLTHSTKQVGTTTELVGSMVDILGTFNKKIDDIKSNP